MKKLSFYTAAALLLGLTACTNNQPQLSKLTKEPALIAKPFKYSAKTWFDTNKAVLRPAGKKQLLVLAAHLSKAKQKGLITQKNKVVVIGHTDSRASMAYNQKLSERRAASVAKYLMSKGVPSTSMTTIGKGKTQPVASNRTHSGMQQNRRVEIHIQGPAINVVYD